MFTKILTDQLAASSSNGVAHAQSGTAGTALTLTASPVTLDSGGAARRVLLTPSADESTNSFTIVGTDPYGRPQTEILAGVANPLTTYTAHDFIKIVSITPTNNTAGNVTFGTNGIGSTNPWIVDGFANPSFFGVNINVTGTVTYNIEGSYDDYTPYWDLNANTPTWDVVLDGTAGTGQNANFNFGGTMLRLTILSGTGKVTASFKQSYAGKTAA